MGRVIHRCNNSRDPYTISPPSLSTTASCSLAISTILWYHHLGHPAPSIMAHLQNLSAIMCNKAAHSLWHACQLGKRTCLPFAPSASTTSEPFTLLHCDIWTSPIPSNLGYNYYLVMLDDFSRFCWTFPLCQKIEVYNHLVDFVAYIYTQFDSVPMCFQANNGTEFVNNAMPSFLSSRGISFRLSCPYTSQ